MSTFHARTSFTTTSFAIAVAAPYSARPPLTRRKEESQTIILQSLTIVELLFKERDADVLKMVLKVCTCHNKPADICPFIRTLRKLRANKFAEAMIEEREVPDV